MIRIVMRMGLICLTIWMPITYVLSSFTLAQIYREGKNALGFTSIGAMTVSSLSDVAPTLAGSTERTFDKCRDQHITTVTIPSMCPDNATLKNRAELLQSRFQIISNSLAPYESLIHNTSKQKKNSTVVVITNALCLNEKIISSSDITVTTHMSTSKVRRLSVLAARWNGPVSVSVKIVSIEDLYEFQFGLRDHFDKFEKVAFHVYFENKDLAYPYNILRNIAFDQVKSDYFANFDVDLFPSPMDTHQHLRSMLDKNPYLKTKLENRNVLILPAFETIVEVPDKNVTLNHPVYPETKEMSLKMIKHEQIQMFWNQWKPGHGSTNYDLWKSNSTDITYPIKVKRWGYEPYFIGTKKDIPRFYRYFRGFGVDKISFTTDLIYSGYSFEVLRDFFIFHVNHPKSSKKDKHAASDLNDFCIKGFMDYLVKEYAAGSLEKAKKLPYWKRWKTRYESSGGTWMI